MPKVICCLSICTRQANPSSSVVLCSLQPSLSVACGLMPCYDQDWANAIISVCATLGPMLHNYCDFHNLMCVASRFCKLPTANGSWIAPKLLVDWRFVDPPLSRPLLPIARATSLHVRLPHFAGVRGVCASRREDVTREEGIQEGRSDF